MFALTSWVQVMIGQRIVPAGYHPLVDAVPDAELVQARRKRARRNRQLRRRDARRTSSSSRVIASAPVAA